MIRRQGKHYLVLMIQGKHYVILIIQGKHYVILMTRRQDKQYLVLTIQGKQYVVLIRQQGIQYLVLMIRQINFLKTTFTTCWLLMRPPNYLNHPFICIYSWKLTINAIACPQQVRLMIELEYKSRHSAIKALFMQTWIEPRLLQSDDLVTLCRICPSQ